MSGLTRSVKRQEMPLPDCFERMDDGSIRIAGHRVSLFDILDSIVSEDGTEDIGEIYPTIEPETLRRVLAFCLRHAEEMREYHDEALRASEAVRLSTVTQGPTRDDLLRRLEQRRGKGRS